MTTVRHRTVLSDELGPELRAELTSLCEEAFGEPFLDEWERVGPGLHVIAEDGGRVVSHAMIVDRAAYVGHEADQAIDVGYIEHVATLPALQGEGIGGSVMAEVGRIIREEYSLGALATGAHAFYEALGWETWLGATAVRTADGELVRSPEEDGSVMVLRTSRTPSGLDLAGLIAIEWRPGEPW